MQLGAAELAMETESAWRGLARPGAEVLEEKPNVIQVFRATYAHIHTTYFPLRQQGLTSVELSKFVSQQSVRIEFFRNLGCS